MNFFDAAIYDLIFKLSGTGTTIFMTFISHLGSAIPLILITIGILIFSKGKGYSKLIAFNLVCSFIISQILKLIIRRPRPELLRLAVEKGFSFPSGHAMVSTVFYGFFIYLIYKKVKDIKKKRIYISLISLLIFLIGISRIYLGVHYATDVIAGHIFGVLYLYFVVKYLYKEKIKQ
ncbi:MAG: phosphatase PAP2 family protein [Clostridia bacterium]|nr:phosphatase PAP2 family protein [Clostridia bacterium]